MTSVEVEAEVKVKVMFRLTDSRPVCLGVKHPSEAPEQNFSTIKQLGLLDVGYHFRRKDYSVLEGSVISGPEFRVQQYIMIHLPLQVTSSAYVLDT
jgi:hypothetical protein